MRRKYNSIFPFTQAFLLIFQAFIATSYRFSLHYHLQHFYYHLICMLIHILQCTDLYNEKAPTSLMSGLLYKKVAATYSPTWYGSTIGDGELNFSVRNGKRWILTAITATIYVLRKNNLIVTTFRVFAVAYALLGLIPQFLSLMSVSLAVTSSKKPHRGRCRAISTTRL